MAQFMQPLPGIGDQASAGGISEVWTISKPELSLTCAHRPLGKGQAGGAASCCWKVKALLATLQILKTTIGLQP